MFITRHGEQGHVLGATCCSGYEGASSSRKVSTGKVGLGEPAGSGMEEKSSPLPSLKTGNSHVFGHKGILVLVTGPACFVLKKEGWQIYVKPNNSNNKKKAQNIHDCGRESPPSLSLERPPVFPLLFSMSFSSCKGAQEREPIQRPPTFGLD